MVYHAILNKISFLIYDCQNLINSWQSNDHSTLGTLDSDFASHPFEWFAIDMEHYVVNHEMRKCTAILILMHVEESSTICIKTYQTEQ